MNKMRLVDHLYEAYNQELTKLNDLLTLKEITLKEYEFEVDKIDEWLDNWISKLEGE